MLNNVDIMGRLTRDPELRHTQSGTSVASFTLACERDFKGTNGEKQTDFINVVAWRNTADFVKSYFTKGRMAVVKGHLQVREYTDRDGHKRYATEVVAESIYFADSNKQGNGNAAPSSGGGYAAPSYDPAPSYGQMPSNQFAELSDNDEDLPF